MESSISGVFMPAETVAEREDLGTRKRRAAERGWAFLTRATRKGERCWPSAQLSLTPDFDTVVPTRYARIAVRSKFGIDIGFDPGGEGFSAMVALAVLPDGEELRELVPVLAERVRQCRHGDRYRFFPGNRTFACDTDCTAMALAGLHRHGLLTDTQLARSLHEVLRSAPDNQTAPGARPGVVAVYWDDATEPEAPLPSSWPLK